MVRSVIDLGIKSMNFICTGNRGRLRERHAPCPERSQNSIAPCLSLAVLQKLGVKRLFTDRYLAAFDPPALRRGRCGRCGCFRALWQCAVRAGAFGIGE